VSVPASRYLLTLLTSNLIRCSQLHYGGGHEGSFATDFSFVLVRGLCFNPCRTSEAVCLLELLEEV